MSAQNNFDPIEVQQKSPEGPIGDERLQVDLRLALNEVAAAEESRLGQRAPRRPSDRELVRLATKLYDARRRRERTAGKQLLAEPAWDMLLALYCFPSRGILLGVKSLADVLRLSGEAGERWRDVLENEGLIERGPRVSKTSQELVRLTEKGRDMIAHYLTRLFHCQGSFGADPYVEID